MKKEWREDEVKAGSLELGHSQPMTVNINKLNKNEIVGLKQNIFILFWTLNNKQIEETLQELRKTYEDQRQDKIGEILSSKI